MKRFALILLACLAGSAGAAAQSYPARTITLTVTAAAGGVTDVVAVPQEAQAQLGFKKAVMVRDPNGHALRLIEE